MVGLGAEAMPAILQADARARHHHARTETHVVRLDEADHHAALVGGGQVDGAALRCMARGEGLGHVGVDHPRAFGQVVRPQHLLGRHPHVARVGHVRIDVGERQFHGLDQQVLGIGMVDWAGRQVEVLQDAQRDQRRDAVAVGRDLMQGVAAVRLADRRHPFRRVVAQIGQGQGGVVGLGVRDQLVGRFAFIEVAPAAGGDALERRRRARQHEVTSACAAHFSCTTGDPA
ncbi:hypothetical protein G6F68_012052 [Rhizopus microsporus]|nr:hypothetical protein G6F68_012052 [Rhizopus microsporus]